MGKHSGAPAEHGPLPRRRLLGHALGITLTVVAWGFLVWAAIDFGADARDGEKVSWVFLGLATVGATACLFVTLILGTRLAAIVRREEEPRPVVPGGRRAAR